VREEGAAAIYVLGPKFKLKKENIDQLRPALQNSSLTIRWHIAATIETLHNNDTDALEVIIEGVSDNSLRPESVKLLKTDAGKKLIVKQLKNAKGTKRAGAIAAFREIEDDPRKLEAVYVEALDKKYEVEVRREAALAIYRLGKNYMLSVIALRPALEDPDPHVSWHIAATMATANPNDDEVLKVIVRGLSGEKEEESIQLLSTEAGKKMVIKQFENTSNDNDRRAVYLATLDKLEPGSSLWPKYYRAGLEDKAIEVRVRAAELIEPNDELAPKILAVLCDSKLDPSRERQGKAKAMLQRVIALPDDTKGRMAALYAALGYNQLAFTDGDEIRNKSLDYFCDNWAKDDRYRLIPLLLHSSPDVYRRARALISKQRPGFAASKSLDYLIDLMNAENQFLADVAECRKIRSELSKPVVIDWSLFSLIRGPFATPAARAVAEAQWREDEEKKEKESRSRREQEMRRIQESYRPDAKPEEFGLGDQRRFLVKAFSAFHGQDFGHLLYDRLDKAKPAKDDEFRPSRLAEMTLPNLESAYLRPIIQDAALEVLRQQSSNSKELVDAAISSFERTKERPPGPINPFTNPEDIKKLIQ
jgi:hypothetical protein